MHQKAVESRLPVDRGNRRRRAGGPFHPLREYGSEYDIVDPVDHGHSDSVRGFFDFLDFTIFKAVLCPVAELNAAEVESPGEQCCKSFRAPANRGLR